MFGLKKTRTDNHQNNQKYRKFECIEEASDKENGTDEEDRTAQYIFFFFFKKLLLKLYRALTFAVDVEQNWCTTWCITTAPFLQ